jgi:predicted dehydrogenase
LVEKPFGITVQACRRIIDAAERNGRTVGVAESAQWDVTSRALAWAAGERYVGDPRMLFWITAEERLTEWGWRDKRLRAGGGWVFDNGVHYVDRWRCQLGEIEEVSAVTEQFEPHRYEEFGSQPAYAFGHEFEYPPGPEREGEVEATIEDTSFATLRFEDGTLGQRLYT